MAVDDPPPEGFDSWEDWEEQQSFDAWLDLLDEYIWDFIEDVLEGDY